MELGQIGEFGLIDRIRKDFLTPQGMLGIGDDCAIIPQSSGKQTLISTDMLVEGTHFIFDSIPPYCLGWKSAAVNISDIAAMGGHPVASFLSLGLPAKVDSEWMEDFIRGYRDISALHSIALLGGDTTRSKDLLCINVGIVGECEEGKAVLRSGAHEGDLICVTGPLGLSAAGLKMMLEGERKLENEFIRCHFLPQPRVKEGLLLSSMEGIGAMMDISDGIASDLNHIMTESGVGARIELDKLPVTDSLKNKCSEWGTDPVEMAVSGGEDYELLFTCRKGSKIPVTHYVIGEITSSGQLEWAGSNKKYTGFRHF